MVYKITHIRLSNPSEVSTKKITHIKLESGVVETAAMAAYFIDMGVSTLIQIVLIKKYLLLLSILFLVIHI